MGQIAFDFEAPAPAAFAAVPDCINLPMRPRPSPSTIADIYELAKFDSALADTRRRDLLSGLNRFATAAGQALDAIPATATAVRQVFASVAPQRVGLKKKSFQTLRSTVAFAIRTYGPIETKQSGAVKKRWNSEWAEFVAQIEVPFRRHALSRFAEFCSAECVSPADVTNSTLAEFYANLLATEVVKSPKNIVHGTVSSWNRAGRDIASWPQIVLTSPTKPVAHILPEADFPESFQADLAAWARRTSSGATSRSIFRNEGMLRPLRPETVKSQLSLFRQVASALVKSGAMTLDEITSLASLCNPIRLETALEFEHSRLNGNDRRVLEIASKMRLLAKHFAGVTPEQIAGLEALGRNRPDRQKEITEKNRSRLFQFDDATNYDRLVQFPWRAAERARRMSNTYRAAKLMEQAVVIAILVRIAPRLATLRQIELSWLCRQRDGSFVLAIPPTAQKGKRALELALGADVGRLIDELIDKFRPALPCASGPYLFPGERGGARSKNAMYEQIVDVGRELGLELNPHLFRHLLQKICAKRDRMSIGDVSRVLGHASASTTFIFYADNSGKEASERLDALLSASSLPAEGRAK